MQDEKRNHEEFVITRQEDYDKLSPGELEKMVAEIRAYLPETPGWIKNVVKWGKLRPPVEAKKQTMKDKMVENWYNDNVLKNKTLPKHKRLTTDKKKIRKELTRQLSSMG